MAFIAAVEVDQRQRLITSTDKLKEMLGGSWTVQDTKKESKAVLDEAAMNGIGTISSLSGELWLRSEQLPPLEETLWKLRQCFVEEKHLPCSFAIIVENTDDPVKVTRRKLEAEVRRVKSGKDGDMAFPALPWFAPCLMQPDRFANEWFPRRADSEQNKRRALLCTASSKRFERGNQTLNEYFERFQQYGYKEPNDLDDFRCGDLNSFIGIIHLDADRNGDVFREFDWADWDQLTRCSEALAKCLNEALDSAVSETLRKAAPISEKFPISPMIAAGDDFLLVTRRDLAIPLVLNLMKQYESAANNDADLKIIRGDETLTLSGSILFARRAYPFSVLSEISADLERSAKSFRKDSSDPQHQGCIDIYWLDSSAREDPHEQRRKHDRYRHGAHSYQLFSAPWTRAQLQAVWEAASALKSAPEGERIPRSKWHDILDALKLGDPLSQFAWRMWRNGLNGKQRKLLNGETAKLINAGLWSSDPEKAPWIEKSVGDVEENRQVTVLHELHRVLETITIAGGAERP